MSQPRIPCFKLAARMGDPAFAKPFLRSGRTGFYLRVIEEGTVEAGDPVVRERAATGSMSVREVAALLGRRRGGGRPRARRGARPPAAVVAGVVRPAGDQDAASSMTISAA